MLILVDTNPVHFKSMSKFEIFLKIFHWNRKISTGRHLVGARKINRHSFNIYIAFTDLLRLLQTLALLKSYIWNKVCSFSLTRICFWYLLYDRLLWWLQQFAELFKISNALVYISVTIKLCCKMYKILYCINHKLHFVLERYSTQTVFHRIFIIQTKMQ